MYDTCGQFHCSGTKSLYNKVTCLNWLAIVMCHLCAQSDLPPACLMWSENFLAQKQPLYSYLDVCSSTLFSRFVKNNLHATKTTNTIGTVRRETLEGGKFGESSKISLLAK